MERLLTPLEVSKLLGLNVMTIYRLVRFSELAAVKLGRRTLRISEGEVMRWLESKKVSSLG